jgi:hypothetical protein
MVGTGRFELPTPRTPSECSTRLSHVPTNRKPLLKKWGLKHSGEVFEIIAFKCRVIGIQRSSNLPVFNSALVPC